MTALDEVATLEGVDENDTRAATPRIRLLVVDDHAAVRRGLWELFDEQHDFRVVGTAPSAARAMAVAERDELDVAVVDYQLGDRNGLWLSRKLKRLPRPPQVVIYSAYCDGWLAAAAAVAGVDGLVSKASLGSELCDSIRGVARGRMLLPPVPWQVAAALRCRLDDAEQAIFGMSLAGVERAEIVRILGLSEAELESRVGRMLPKLESIDHASWERSAIVG